MNNFKVISSNWRYVLPPSRPSINELNRIKGYLLNLKKDAPIAILGSTIEFRDLLFLMGFRDVTVFEKNQDFYEWTKEWLIDSVQEKIIIGDWRDTLQDHKNTYAIILSDLTMGNIEYEDRTAFYQAINNALVSDGLFIDKVLTQHANFISLSQIQDTYELLPLNLQTLNYFNCEAFFCSELLKGGLIDTSQFYKTLQLAFCSSGKLLKYLEKCKLITPEGCIWYYGRDWNELKPDYYKAFSTHTLFEDDITSPYYGRVKQYFNFK